MKTNPLKRITDLIEAKIISLKSVEIRPDDALSSHLVTGQLHAFSQLLEMLRTPETIESLVAFAEACYKHGTMHDSPNDAYDGDSRLRYFKQAVRSELSPATKDTVGKVFADNADVTIIAERKEKEEK